MEFNILPLVKTHYSIGKSILTLEKPADKKSKKYAEGQYSSSIFDLLIDNKVDTLVLVEDNLSGLLQASEQCQASKIKLILGLRIDVTEDMDKKDEASLTKRARYIVFASKPSGYKNLIKIASSAAGRGFYYSPCIDFKTLKTLWDDTFLLVVPFYDSFIYNNTFCSHLHVPDIAFTDTTFLVEDNDLPFDDELKTRVERYCVENKHDILPAQSIFYPRAEDFEAYVAFRCIHNRGTSQKSTLDRPELDHMGSNQFNFMKWFNRNKG
jgi:DNA polymerase III alpha subunit